MGVGGQDVWTAGQRTVKNTSTEVLANDDLINLMLCLYCKRKLNCFRFQNILLIFFNIIYIRLCWFVMGSMLQKVGGHFQANLFYKNVDKLDLCYTVNAFPDTDPCNFDIFIFL